MLFSSAQIWETCSSFYGFFKILECIGKVAYKLELPSSTIIHLVFHFSQLRLARGVTNSSLILSLQLNSKLEMLVWLELLLRVRLKFRGQLGDIKVLLKWKSLPAFAVAWEYSTWFKNNFLNFTLRTRWMFGREIMIGHRFVLPILGERVIWGKHKHVVEVEFC